MKPETLGTNLSNTRHPFQYELIAQGWKPVYRNGMYPSEIHMFETALSMKQKIISVRVGMFLTHSESGENGNLGNSDYDLFLEPPVRVEWWWVNPACHEMYSYESEDNHKRLMISDGGWYPFKATYHGDEIISVELVKNEE